MKRVYLDHNAGTRIDDRVLDEYIRATRVSWANPSSVHREGQAARSMLAQARLKIASLFSVSSGQVVFFSSATEAVNTLIRGICGSTHIITSTVEHPALWNCCQAMNGMGTQLSLVQVGKSGYAYREDVEKVVQPESSGMVFMSVNNETGVVADIEGYACLAKQHNIPLIVDGVAQLGKRPFHLIDGIAAACFSSYKVHGPAGVAFAILHKDIRFSPLLEGGGQEFGMRSGTENVAAIHACSVAVDLLLAEMADSCEKMQALRDYFEHSLVERLSGVFRNGEGQRVCSTSNLSFEGIVGDELLICLDRQGIAASHGAACSAGAIDPSRVLLAMGYDEQRGKSAIRFSFGKYTTIEETEYAIEKVIESVQRLRSIRGNTFDVRDD